LVSEGRPITLVSGDTVRVQITNRCMVKIEDLFGSYAAFRLALSGGGDTQKWTAMSKGIWCALQHDPEWRNDWNKVLDSLDPAKVLDDYQDALLDALVEAFPPTPAHREEPPKSEPATGESDGPSSMPPAGVISDSDTTSSGT
jgi:hypothetical protein